MALDEFNKVSFVTTYTDTVPDKLKETGALTVFDDKNDIVPDTFNNETQQYLYFRGNIIAGGVGFKSKEMLSKATYAANNYESLEQKVDDVKSITIPEVDTIFDEVFPKS